MNETIQVHGSPQCNGAMQTQTEGGAILPSKKLLCKSYPCKQCGELIIVTNLNKKYCDSCRYIRKRKNDLRWRENNPEKFKLQQLRTSLRNGHKLRSEIFFCIDCGKDISDRHGHAFYCIDCSDKHTKMNLQRNSKIWYNKNYDRCLKLNREWRWRQLEKSGIKFEKRFLIDNCVICDKNISMYHSNAKYCSSCSERNSYHTLGTTDFSSHMIRKYNDNFGMVMPDWEAERIAVNSQLNLFGLK